MTYSRRIYLLDPKKLSPETIAVAFAKTSRSPKSFDEIAAELSDYSSADFHEKWVVGYGHSSVAEHAILHIAVENISRLAIECLESNRLASYTEKSSRYQIWDEDSFYIPEEIKGGAEETIYVETNKLLFKEYLAALEAVGSYLRGKNPQIEGESERAYKNRIRASSADICRYFLPTSSLANVGLTINARALEHALCKMLSHPLQEVRNIGKEIKKVSIENTPTLVKYANLNDYLIQAEKQTGEFISSIDTEAKVSRDWCSCVDFDKKGELKILAALMYRFSSLSYLDAFTLTSNLPEMEVRKLANTLLGNLACHDIPLREMEYANVTFDLILDQGAYFELKRHRMMSQTVQPFTPQLGYAVPKIIKKAGLLKSFSSSMEQAKKAYGNICIKNPHAAQYILPNAFNRRVLLKMNLRSALHLVNLRCAPNAHFGIRRSTLRIAEEIRSKFPLFAPYFSAESQESWQSLEDAFFYKTC